MTFGRMMLGLVFAAACFAPAASAQCSDPWVSTALNTMKQQYGWVINGSGNTGDCDIHRYGGGTWSSQALLNDYVKYSRLCGDPWIGEVYETTADIRRPPSGSGVAGECSPSLYGNWSSYQQLTGIIQAYVKRITPTHTNMLQPITSGTVRFADQLGGCLGVENGSTQPMSGSRIIHWNCQDIRDQKFVPVGPSASQQIYLFNNETIRPWNTNIADTFCLDAQGGARPGAQIIAYSCKSSSSRWTITPQGQIKQGNLCLALRTGIFVGNNDATLQPCNGQSNQQFRQQ